MQEHQKIKSGILWLNDSTLEVGYGVDYAPLVGEYDYIVTDFDNTLALTESKKRKIICNFFKVAGVSIDDDFLHMLAIEPRHKLILKYSQFFHKESDALTALSFEMRNMYSSIEMLHCHKDFLSQRNVIVVTAGKKVEIVECLHSNGVNKKVRIVESNSKNKNYSYQSLNLKGRVVAIGDSISDMDSAQSMCWDFIKVVV